MAAIEGKGVVKRVGGFIDHMRRAICRPDKGQKIYYSGYMKCHAVKYPALSTPDSLIAHPARPYAGRESDRTVYQGSGLVGKLGEL